MGHTPDVIVVGLGAAGSACLYHLARQGVHATGFDRYAPPHRMGSTHSESRIIRKAYFEGPQYLPLLERAFELWRTLEAEAGTQLMHLNGCLNIGPLAENAAASARQAGITVETLSASEVQNRFPAYRMSDSDTALLDHEAGYIDPERCVETLLKRAQGLGAVCRFDTPVTALDKAASHVGVRTTSAYHRAQAVVVAVGAWMRDLVCAPLRVERVTTTWFAPNAPRLTPEHCPVFIYEAPDGTHSYGIPDLGQGVKIGLHHVGPEFDHPDDVPRAPTVADAEAVREVAVQVLPAAAGRALRTRACLYTNTPDHDYLIDYAPQSDRRIVVGSACSGHGFKASIAVGEALAALALGMDPGVNVTPFRWRWAA